MLDIVIAPDFETLKRIFVSYSQPRHRGRKVQVFPANGGGLHFGSSLTLAADGKLFVTLAERYKKYQAQDPKTRYGKVVRINVDGSVPTDNPFVGDQFKAQPHVWSIERRNPQSAAIHPESGKLWTLEHGARRGDAINIPQASKKYGWAVIT